MQSNNPARKAVKVTFQGETKRLKLSGDYQELVKRTSSAFKNLPPQIKFFYLDEDNEIISISSQSDYTEALEIEDIAALRLTVATSAADARQQLLTQLEDQRPLAESLNCSQVMSQQNLFGRSSSIREGIMMAESEFDAVSHQELAQSIHSIAPVAAMRARVSIGTDIMPPAVRAEAACNTARVQTSDKLIDTCVQMNDCSS